MRKLFLVLAILASWSLPAVAQAPAPAVTSAPPLADPAIVRLADGVERVNPQLAATEAYLPILFPSSHAANLLELANGDLLCVWFSGSWEGDSGVGIVLSRRPRGSHTWQRTLLVDSEPGFSYQNPVLFQEPNGTLDLYHTTQGAKAGEAHAQVLHLVSQDNGVTWSKPEPLFRKPGAYSRHPLLILKDGSWLLPLTYVTSEGIGKGAETNYSAAELTRDGGKSWKECLMPETFGKVQPTVVPLASGQLRAFFRSRASDSIYAATSADGCAWTPATATPLPNNNASVQAFRLHSGHVAIVFDNSSKAPQGPGALRKPLSIALSEDAGKTWPYVRDIEVGREGFGAAQQAMKTPGREEYSYPTVLQTSSGEILVAFTYRRQTIKVVSVDEDWIKKGHTTGQYKGLR